MWSRSRHVWVCQRGNQVPHYGRIFLPSLCLRSLFACKWVCLLIIAKKSESHFPVLVLSEVSYPWPTPAFISARAKPGTVSCGTVKERVISVDNHWFPSSHFGLQRRMSVTPSRCSKVNELSEDVSKRRLLYLLRCFGCVATLDAGEWSAVLSAVKKQKLHKRLCGAVHV